MKFHILSVKEFHTLLAISVYIFLSMIEVLLKHLNCRLASVPIIQKRNHPIYHNENFSFFTHVINFLS
jgi:hypothetical protein